MLIKEKVKMSRVDENNKKHNFTIIVCGRTREELQGRIDKLIARQMLSGATLR